MSHSPFRSIRDSILRQALTVALLHTTSQYASGDQFLTTLGMSFSHRWRDFGFMIAYILFVRRCLRPVVRSFVRAEPRPLPQNVFLVYALTYLFQIVDWGSVNMPWKKKSSSQVEVGKTSEKADE